MQLTLLNTHTLLLQQTAVDSTVYNMSEVR